VQELIIRDVRLSGPRPRGDEVLEVDENTPLDWPFRWIGSKSDQYKGDVSLKILAHGYETRAGFLAGSRGTPLAVYSQGGSGIQFCREGIVLGTISQFVRIRGKVKMIEILGCGAAYITPGCEGREGDGNLLCFRLAQIAQTIVRASTATQIYSNDGPIDMGPWEGTVLTYGPSGAVVKVEHAPEK
jgi:hypothetical protein